MYGKVEFAVAVLYVLGAVLLYVSGPQTMGPSPAAWPMLPGIALAVIGFVWMIRIYRADPEPDQRFWRYRSRR